MEIKNFYRTEGVPEIDLKTFYTMSNEAREAHICALQSIPFKSLSQRDLYVVFFWYQNWLLTDWPSNKKNFISIVDEIVAPEDVHICAPIPKLESLTIEELIQKGEECVREYLDEFFKNEYEDWETNVRFNTVEKFVHNTNNFMELDDLTIKFVQAYKKLKQK